MATKMGKEKLEKNDGEISKTGQKNSGVLEKDQRVTFTMVYRHKNGEKIHPITPQIRKGKILMVLWSLAVIQGRPLLLWLLSQLGA